jgi:hypothetical protein
MLNRLCQGLEVRWHLNRHQLTFPTPLAARQAIADELRLPLAKLSEEDRAFIDRLLAETLSRPAIIAAVRERFPAGRKGGIGGC